MVEVHTYWFVGVHGGVITNKYVLQCVQFLDRLTFGGKKAIFIRRRQMKRQARVHCSNNCNKFTGLAQGLTVQNSRITLWTCTKSQMYGQKKIRALNGRFSTNGRLDGRARLQTSPLGTLVLVVIQSATNVDWIIENINDYRPYSKSFFKRYLNPRLRVRRLFIDI